METPLFVGIIDECEEERHGWQENDYHITGGGGVGCLPATS
jgi:hypothetical protein